MAHGNPLWLAHPSTAQGSGAAAAAVWRSGQAPGRPGSRTYRCGAADSASRDCYATASSFFPLRQVRAVEAKISRPTMAAPWTGCVTVTYASVTVKRAAPVKRSAAIMDQ